MTLLRATSSVGEELAEAEETGAGGAGDLVMMVERVGLRVWVSGVWVWVRSARAGADCEYANAKDSEGQGRALGRRGENV